MRDESASLKTRAWEAIRRFEPAMRELALRILRHPELGYAEVQACRWLSAALAEEGFVVEGAVGGLPTAFRACQGSEAGPTVAFLAEYDALPGVGHGCGHNLIGPAAVGAALGVAAALPELGGRICVIGTPAEEYLGQVEGKIRLLEAGAFDEVSVALMMHPQYEFRLPGSDLGFIACELHFHGRPAHAAADPWHGANALDGLLLTFNNLNALRQHLRPEIRVHGIVTEGGQAPNIIPERASARLMVRAPDMEQLEAVYQRVADCAHAGALASDTRLEMVRITTVHNSVSNATLNGLIGANLALLGETVNPAPLDISGSSDFGNLSQVLPAAMFWAGTHPKGIAWHSAEVARASGQEMALRAMVVSACALAGVAVDLLGDQEPLEKVRADFVAARG
jgi:amidohydrolase